MTDAPAPTGRSRRGAMLLAGAAVVALVIAGGAAWFAVTSQAEPAATSTPTPTPSPTPTATPTPTPTPTPAGYPADTVDYPLDALPQVDVYAVIPALQADTDPYGPLGGEVVRAAADRIPVFADPLAGPVAALPRDYTFDGTSVPVIERQEHWVHVLLTGRSALPSAGDPGHLTGWLRAQDVESSQTAASVEVDIAARTVDIVHADGGRERIATDFAWGTPATPTPLGRTFIMLIRSEPSFTYTRGYPLVYLGVQSPTLDGFAGAQVAVTAFHYHDARSGDISNGCLRVAPETIERLAQLPLGTPVVVR